MSEVSSDLLLGCKFNHVSHVASVLKSKSVCTQVTLYPIASALHVVDLGFKSLLFAIYAIGVIGGILAVILTAGCSKDAREFIKNSTILLTDVSIVMVIDVLGCVLGPIAYKIEDLARVYITDKMVPGSKDAIEYQESCNWAVDNNKGKMRTNN